MVVMDEATLNDALALLSSHGRLRVVDEFKNVIVSDSRLLESYARSAWSRNSILIVAPEGESIEDFYPTLVRVRRQRVEDVKRRMREWLRNHPEFTSTFREELRKGNIESAADVERFISRWKKRQGV